MIKLGSLGIAFAVALTGACATERRGDDGMGDGSGSEPTPPPPTPPMDLVGTYRVHSELDLATNLPGSAGSFLGGLIAATDDPDDPMSWLVDQMLAQMDDGGLKDLLVTLKPFVIGELNDQLTELAPELVGTLVTIGQRLEEATRHLGLDEKLVVGYVDQTYTGQIIADGVRFTIDTTTTEHVFADHGIADAVAGGIYLRFENESSLTISEHTLALPYGQIARLALDAAVIPTLDPTATGLADLLDNVVDCQGVGASVASALGFGSPALFENACLAGLDQAADSVYDQLIASDATLDLHLTGKARAADTNQDRKIDKLQAGEWTGSMTYEATDAPLASPATFVGARM